MQLHVQEQFEATIGIIRSRNLKKDRPCNDQKENGRKEANNGRYNPTQKTNE